MLRKVYKVISLSIIAMLVLAGCGNTDNNKKSVIVAVQQSFNMLDPYQAKAAGDKEVLFNIFEGLVKCDINGDYISALAESYEISQDYLKYKFIIRDNVKFHNGGIMKIDDVIYSLNRAVELAKATSPLKNIDKINGVDTNAIELILKEPDRELLVYLTTATASIIPKDYSEQETMPVGTGPFKFVEHVPNERLVIERYDDYYLQDKKAKVEEVVFKIVASVDAAFLELKAGNIDIFPYLTADKTDQVTDKYNIKEGNQNLIELMALNNNAEPFNNIKVRQAVNCAINKRDLLELTSYGHGVEIGTNLSPKSMPEYYIKETEQVNSYNIDRAKQLLTEAGYSENNPLSFTISVPSNYQFHIEVASVIVDQLGRAGIKATISTVDWNTVWLPQVYKAREYQATIIGLTPMLSPRDALARYKSSDSDNFMNFSNSGFDEVFELAVRETDKSKQIEYYKELQMILAEDAASVYLQDPSMLVAVNKRIDGYSFYPYYVQDMSTVYFVE